MEKYEPGEAEDSTTKAGTFDIRQTSQEWIQTIDGLSNEALIFNMIQSLARCPAMIKADSSDNRVQCSYSQEDLIYYALEKYIQIMGGDEGIQRLLMRFSESEAEELQKPETICVDLLPLLNFIVDFIHRRRETHELKMLQTFFNAYKHYLPQYYEKIKIKGEETRELIKSLGDTEIFCSSVQEEVSGIIDNDK